MTAQILRFPTERVGAIELTRELLGHGIIYDSNDANAAFDDITRAHHQGRITIDEMQQMLLKVCNHQRRLQAANVRKLNQGGNKR